MSETNKSKFSDENSIHILKENMKYLEELQEFNQTPHKNVTNSLKNDVLPAVRKLLGFCKTNYQNMEACKLPEDNDPALKDIFLRVNLLLNEQMRLFMYSIPDLFENSFLSSDCTSRGNENKVCKLSLLILRSIDYKLSIVILVGEGADP